MATFVTTNRHDYRWPQSRCLVPKAEAPGPCYDEGRGGNAGSGTTKPWCTGDPPAPPPPSKFAHARVCIDLVEPSAKSEPRPWCQRGPVSQLVNPQSADSPTTVAVVCSPSKTTPMQAPKECRNENRENQLTKPWCNKGAEPRLVAARMGAAPVQDTSRYDQPNQYLQKLCEKYPQTNGVITATPRDELMRRVYADRYRSTYQADYCKNADDSARLIGQCDSWDPDERQRTAVGVESKKSVCNCGCKGDGVGVGGGGGGGGGAAVEAGEPRIHPLACRPAAVSHNVHFSCCSKKKIMKATEEVGPAEKLPPWSSEYSESIGRTGQMIMDQKLLYAKKKKKFKMC